MALNTMGESSEITLGWIPVHFCYEGNELADQPTKRGSNNDRATKIKLPMLRCVCNAALRRKTIVSSIDSYKLNPPMPRCLKFCGGTSSLRIWSGWIWGTFEQPLKFWLAMLVSIIISANVTALYNPSAHYVRRSTTLSPICWHNVQCFGSWKSRTSITHYTTVTDIVDRFHLKRIIGYVNRINRLEFWDTKATIRDKSSDPETVSYCYMISTWLDSTGDWAPSLCAR